jgi:sec-independent protein translocase protein TatC
MSNHIDQDKTFWEHLNESKNVLFQCVIVWLLGTGVCWWQFNNIFTKLIEPIQKYKLNLNFLSPFDGLMFTIKVICLSGFILTAPIIFTIVWRYVSDIFSDTQKKLMNIYLIVGSILGFVGAYYAFVSIVPVSLSFLLEITPQGTSYLLTGTEYLNFVLSTVIFLAIFFELPIVIFGLVHFNILTREQITSKRKEAYFCILALSAMFGSPDVFSWFLSSFCIFVLFEASLLLTTFIKKPLPKNQ